MVPSVCVARADSTTYPLIFAVFSNSSIELNVHSNEGLVQTRPPTSTQVAVSVAVKTHLERPFRTLRAPQIYQGFDSEKWYRRWDSNPHGPFSPTVFETVRTRL